MSNGYSDKETAIGVIGGVIVLIVYALYLLSK